MSADNQQETFKYNDLQIRDQTQGLALSEIDRDPQRLHAKYPTKKEITDKEAILLGILFTDGCLSKKGKNSWRFYLGNTSYGIIQTFKNCFIELFKLESYRIKIYKSEVNNKPFYRAIVNSGNLGNYMFSKYGTFRTLAYKDNFGKETYPNTKLPINRLKTSTKLTCEFLRAAFSCDGGVNLYVAKAKYRFLIRNVYITCSHPRLQLDYNNLLKWLEIGSKIIPKDKKILIQGRNNLNKFKNKIGFLDGAIITQNSAYWQGWEKNKVLELALSSYDNASEIICLSKFKDNDIVRTHERS